MLANAMVTSQADGLGHGYISSPTLKLYSVGGGRKRSDKSQYVGASWVISAGAEVQRGAS